MGELPLKRRNKNTSGIFNFEQVLTCQSGRFHLHSLVLLSILLQKKKEVNTAITIAKLYR